MVTVTVTRVAVVLGAVFVIEAVIAAARGDWSGVDRSATAFFALAVGFVCGDRAGAERVRSELRGPVNHALELARRARDGAGRASGG